MSRFIKNIKRGISYFKQGYKSNDWDWGYLMEDLIFKLKRMERTIRNNQLIVEADAVGDEIKEVYELLDKVKEEEIIKFWSFSLYYTLLAAYCGYTYCLAKIK